MDKTVTVLPESQEHVIFLRLSGMVTGEDYSAFVKGKLADTVTRYGHYDILIHFSSGFEGWTEEGARASFLSIANYGQKTRNVAYVNAPDSLHMLLKISKPLIKGKTLFFDEDKMEEAAAWITSHPL